MRYAVAFALILTHATPAFADDCAVTVHSGAGIHGGTIDTGNHTYGICTDENVRDVTISGVAIAQNMSGMGRIADPAPQQQPYTRADFTRDCIKLAPASEPARSDWIKRCSKEAP
jgi:hypothetical protein